jgi:hypothetical protein
MDSILPSGGRVLALAEDQELTRFLAGGRREEGDQKEFIGFLLGSVALQAPDLLPPARPPALLRVESGLRFTAGHAGVGYTLTLCDEPASQPSWSAL